MVRRIVVFLLMSASAEFGQLERVPGANSANNFVPLGKRLLDPIARKRFEFVDTDELPGAKLALDLLNSKTCSAAVGGAAHQKFVRGRLLSTRHFKLWESMISGEETATGVQTIYAITAVDDRWVFLLPSFYAPQSVFTRLFAGGAARKDTLRNMEIVEGFRPGSLTIELLQALILLHEQQHLNETAIDDSWCLALSMLNTRRLAEKCAPQIVEPAHDPKMVVTIDHSQSPKDCSGCHVAAGINIKLPISKTTKKRG